MKHQAGYARGHQHFRDLGISAYKCLSQRWHEYRAQPVPVEAFSKAGFIVNRQMQLRNRGAERKKLEGNREWGRSDR